MIVGNLTHSDSRAQWIKCWLCKELAHCSIYKLDMGAEDRVEGPTDQPISLLDLGIQGVWRQVDPRVGWKAPLTSQYH